MAPQQMGHLVSATEHSLQDTRWPHGMKTIETSLSIHILHSFSCCSFRSFSSGSSSGRNNTFLLRKSIVTDHALPFYCQSVSKCVLICMQKKKNPLHFKSHWISRLEIKEKSPNQLEGLRELSVPRTWASAPLVCGGQFKQSWMRASRLE